MKNNKFNLIWTATWLLFIFLLCLAFNDLHPLWLLIIWLLGYED